MKVSFLIVVMLLSISLQANANLTRIETLMKHFVSEDKIFTYVPRGLVVSFDEKLFFKTNHDKISPEGVCILEKISNVIKSTDNLCIIEGHTKNLDKNNSIYSQNWELSTVRANNIAEYLIRCSKVKPEHVFSIGFGEYMPFHDNVSYKGNLDNRIDFVFLEYRDLGND